MSQNRLIADLHLHSRYSLATSPKLDIPTLTATAMQKGITLLAAPDFTHPTWRREMRSELVDAGDGVYRPLNAPVHAQDPTALNLPLLGDGSHGDVGEEPPAAPPHFVLVTEISCIWSQGGRSRRVHVLLMAPSFEAAERFSEVLSGYQDLESDGRPMIKMSAADLYSAALEIDDRFVLFPAHAWTPWYGVYGSKSGFDSLEECFREMTPLVPAVETGLSSNPHMNWGVSDIGDRAIVSFSDPHSPATMGRELTVLDATPDFDSITSALFENRVIETVEFHPEHGKYHLNGHRKCGVKVTPEDTPDGGRCPVCGRPLTLGVLHRISELADRSPAPPELKDGLLHGDGPKTRPFRQLVPLRELVAQGLSAGVNTKKVAAQYSALISSFVNELTVLTKVPEDALAQVCGERIAGMIVAVRTGNVEVEAGYDGVYGTVSAAVKAAAG